MKPNFRSLQFFMIALLLAAGESGAAATIADILLAQGFHRGTVLREEGGNGDFIEVVINGHPFTLLIDTGSDVTTLRESAAKKAHIPFSGSAGAFVGMNGVGRGHTSIAQVSSCTIDGYPFAPGQVLVAPLGDSGRFGNIRFDGVIGLLSMKLNHVLFAYVPGEFFFQSKESAAGSLNSFLLEHGFARIQLACEERKYFIPVSFNGSTARMILDSGAYATLLSIPFGERAKLQSARLFRNVTGSDGRSFVTVPVMPGRIEIGPLLLPRIPVTAGNAAFLRARLKNGEVFADGSLGFDLVGRLFPLLDTGHDWLYIIGFRPLRYSKS
jgi:predicted aspartyl protease